MSNLPATQSNQAISPFKAMGDLLITRRPNLEKLLPKGLSFDRFLACVMNSARKNPAVAKCSPDSIFMAAKASAELGLEPDTGLGHAYLIPYGSELTFVPGYRGWVTKLYACAGITVRAVVVYEGERFILQEGTDPSIEHEPVLEGPRSDDKIVAVYAVATMQNGTKTFVVLTKADVDKVRAASKSGRSEYSPWTKWYAEMAKKTAIKRLVKVLPLANEELSKLMDAEAEDAVVIEHKPGQVRKSLDLRAKEEEPFTATVEEKPQETREPGSDG